MDELLGKVFEMVGTYSNDQKLGENIRKLIEEYV